MADIYCEYGGDFVMTPNGSLQAAVHWDQIREKIIRFMLTNSSTQLPDGSYTPPDYLFDPKWGLSGGALVDQTPTQAFLSTLKGRIRHAVLSCAEVDPGSEPTITIQQPDLRTYQIFVAVRLINGQSGQVALALGPGS